MILGFRSKVLVLLIKYVLKILKIAPRSGLGFGLGLALGLGANFPRGQFS